VIYLAGKIKRQELSSDLTTELDNKQPLDTTLTALTGLDTTSGVIAQTGTDTFTKRTITGTTNAIVVTNGDGVSGNPTLNIGTNVVTLTDTQTLTNKTLTSPIISTITNTGTLTLPTSTDTLTGKATTDILTNKTIDSAGTGNTLKNVVLNYTGTVTLANIQSGITLIAGVSGRTIKVLRYFVKPTGTFTTGTSVILQDTNSTPVVITTMLVAALTNGAKISSEVVVANVTDGAGFRVNLTADKGIAIPAVANMAGGTSLLISIDYMIV
jgi:hypothetical protein